MSYTRVTWINEETPLNAANLNRMEDGIEEAISVAADIFNRFYPVGSYYETSDTAFDPNTSWGGTWVLEMEGQVHVSAGTNYAVLGALTDTSDGGAASHVLTADELPAHTHGNKSLTGAVAIRKSGDSAHTAISRSGIVTEITDTGSNTTSLDPSSTPTTLDRIAIDASHEHESVGSGAAHNNMQPYIVVNRWHRIA